MELPAVPEMNRGALAGVPLHALLPVPGMSPPAKARIHPSRPEEACLLRSLGKTPRCSLASVCYRTGCYWSFPPGNAVICLRVGLRWLQQHFRVFGL